MIARFVTLAGDLILREHQPLDLPLAELHVYVLHVDLAHQTAHELPFLVGELGEHVVALRLMQFLQDHLLCRLRGDAPEFLRDEFFAQNVARLGGGLLFQRRLERDLAVCGRFSFNDRLHEKEADGPLLGRKAHFHLPRLAHKLLYFTRRMQIF